MTTDSRCWFAEHLDAGPCEGQLVRVHLLNQSEMKRRFPYGAVLLEDADGGEAVWWRVPRRYDVAEEHGPYRTLKELQEDERSFVPGCGGITGISGHHGAFDGYRLRVPRSLLPEGTEEYAVELGMDAWVTRFYGEREEMAA